MRQHPVQTIFSIFPYMQEERTLVFFDWAIMYSVNVVYFDLGSGRDYIYHGTTTFRGLHYKDELKLTDKQKEEFARLEVKDITTQRTSCMWRPTKPKTR